MAITKATEKCISDNLTISGIATASNFKTGTTNVHNVGVEVAHINILGADTPIGTGSTIYDDGGARFSGVVTATSFSGSGANLTSIPAGNLTGTLPAISGGNLTNLNGSNISSGIVTSARLGGGTASNSTFLRGDGTFAEAGGGKLLQVVSTKTTTANSTSNASAGDYYPLTSDAITVTSGSTLYIHANYHHWTQDVNSNIIYGRQGLEREIGASGSWSAIRGAGAYESFSVATVNAGGGGPGDYINQIADIASLNAIYTHGQSTGTTIKVRIRHNHQVPNGADLLVFHRTGIESNIIIYEVGA